MCGYCDVENKKLKEKVDLFTDEEIETILLGIFYGVITTKNLDLSTYLKVARKLSEGVFRGYGKTLFEVKYGTEDWLMLKALEENVYIFSGAKQYQMVREMSFLLTKKVVREGVKVPEIASFADFKKQAKGIFTEYNENYLYAEYNSAIAQARTASQWQEIVKDAQTQPMLTYQTVGDARVRPTHAELDNIARPVFDKFWDSYMPPNGWNCRCTVVQDDETRETNLSGFKQPDDVPDIFMFNAGKEKIVFSPKHPYFKVAPRDKNWAMRNFGMPMP